MVYSQGIAQFADLFAPAGSTNAAAEFVARIFRILLGGQPLHEVNRSFHWFPMPVTEATRLIESTGLRLNAEFGGCDHAPFVAGQSRVRLVVASAR